MNEHITTDDPPDNERADCKVVLDEWGPDAGVWVFWFRRRDATLHLIEMLSATEGAIPAGNIPRDIATDLTAVVLYNYPDVREVTVPDAATDGARTVASIDVPDDTLRTSAVADASQSHGQA